MSRKPRPILQDMPTHLKKRIADNLERYIDKVALRSFSPDFREIIGDPQAQIEEILFNVGETTSRLKIINDGCVLKRVYHSTELGCNIWKGMENWFKAPNNSDFVKDRDHVQVALEEFQAYVDNPNLTVKTFRLAPCKKTPVLPEKLKVHKFNVRYAGDQNDVLPVLSRLDADVLKELNFFVDDSWNSTTVPEFNEIVKLDQWKKVRNLHLCEVLGPIIPMEHWWNIPRISVTMGSNIGQLPALIEHFRRCPGFKSCSITTSQDLSENKKIIGKDLVWIFEGYMNDETFIYPAEERRYPLKIDLFRRGDIDMYRC